MFKRLKDLFAILCADSLYWFAGSGQWIRIPDLSIALDIYTGELSFGDGSSTSLGQDVSTLAPLGPPDEHPELTWFEQIAFYHYQDLGMSISIDFREENEDPDLVGNFYIDFRQPIVVPCLINGRPANLSSSTTLEEVIELLNDLPEVEPYIEDDGSVLTCQWYKDRCIWWNFEAGKLQYLTLVLVY